MYERVENQTENDFDVININPFSEKIPTVEHNNNSKVYSLLKGDNFTSLSEKVKESFPLEKISS